MDKNFKTRYEYCHILSDKLVITQTPEIGNLIEGYTKSVNNVFKTLMVFIVFIPIFTGLSIVFLNLGKPGLAIYAGAIAFFFLVMAFYTMLFTSGTPVIKKDCIYKITVHGKVFNNVIAIIYKESGRYKRRYLILENDQISKVTALLLSENLVTEKDIALKASFIGVLPLMIAFTSFTPLFTLLLKDVQIMMAYYGMVMAILGLIVLVGMVRKTIGPFFYKIK
jgi:hypothetical protein